MLKHTYQQLDSKLWSSVTPDPLNSPRLVHWNQALFLRLGLPSEWKTKAAEILSGNHVPSDAKPIAMAYAGHQFGHFAGQLGDGRGMLLGEVQTDKDSTLYDLHLKGAGKTPYSRGGDGRAVLRSSIREHLAGQFLSACGVASSESLGLVSSSTSVQRERMESAAALLRVSDTHIRLGHFEWINAYGASTLTDFTDYVIDRHFPELRELTDGSDVILALAQTVIKRSARMIADWQLVGFCHGVMNTDNLSITGTTLDFGPYEFMESFDPTRIFNHTDARGRYTYQNQPHIAHWNLSIWAGQLLPLGEHRKADLQSALDQFAPEFLSAYHSGLAAKFSLNDTDETRDFTNAWLNCLQTHRLDYTNAFVWLTGDKPPLSSSDLSAEAENNFTELLDRHAKLLKTESNGHPIRPIRMIPRRHLLDSVIAASEAGEYELIEQVFDALAKPFEAPTNQGWLRPSPDGMGSLSCSS
jgi:uncharacterized protein YdiU (UPF0061 family)